MLLPLIGLWATAVGHGDLYGKATAFTVSLFIFAVVLSFAGLVAIFATRRGRALPAEFRVFAVSALVVVFGGMSICRAPILPGLMSPH